MLRIGGSWYNGWREECPGISEMVGVGEARARARASFVHFTVCLQHSLHHLPFYYRERVAESLLKEMTRGDSLNSCFNQKQGLKEIKEMGKGDTELRSHSSGTEESAVRS